MKIEQLDHLNPCEDLGLMKRGDPWPPKTHPMLIFHVPSHPVLPHRLDIDVAAKRRLPDACDRQRREEVRCQLERRRK